MKYLSLYLISLIILSTNGICASFVIGLSSGQLVLIRMAIGSIVLLFAMLITRQRFTFPAHKRSLMFQVLAGISNGLNYLFMFESYRLIGVSMTTIIMYVAPAIIVILSPLLFKEKLTAGKIIGFSVVLLGFLLINSDKGVARLQGKGLLYALGACACYVMVIIFNKYAKELPGLEKSFLQILISALVVFIYLAITSELDFSIPHTDIFPILYLGIVAAGLGSFLYYSTLPHLSAQTISAFSYMQPVSTLILSFFILYERLSPHQLSGAFLIVGGALFTEVFHANSPALNRQTCKHHITERNNKP